MVASVKRKRYKKRKTKSSSASSSEPPLVIDVDEEATAASLAIFWAEKRKHVGRDSAQEVPRAAGSAIG